MKEPKLIEIFADNGEHSHWQLIDDNGEILWSEEPTEVKNNAVLPIVSGLLHMSKDDEIGLYEKFLDEFTDKEGQLVKCNHDAIFNWFGWQLWRSKQ